MSYCTLAELEDRFGEPMLLQVSDWGETAPTEPDADLFARAIADADAKIDSYLFSRYALPLAETPTVIRDISLRISIYYAHSNVAGEKVTADYKEAIRDLESIAKGTMKLDVAGVEVASSGSGGVQTNEPNREMTGETMKGYI